MRPSCPTGDGVCQSAGGFGSAFPTPAAMAGAPESFYRDAGRAAQSGDPEARAAKP